MAFGTAFAFKHSNQFACREEVRVNPGNVCATGLLKPVFCSVAPQHPTMTPEKEISVDPEEAKQMGAFVEDALTPEEALESAEDNGPEVL
jgi:hypothetical protein